MCDMKRSEQRVENTWKMEDIYASMEAYNADVQKVQALLKEYEALQGTLGKDAEYLLRALMLDEQISMIYSELAVYANQRYHEDTGNAVYQKLTGEVQTLGVQMMQSISWFQPELLALPEARLTQYYAEEPKLEGYRRQVEEVTRMRDHILDTKTEELLARNGPAELPRGVMEVTLYPAGEGRVQTVEFLCGGWGVGPSTSYWGISHVPSDVLTGFQGAALSGWEPWDGGWLWREAGGDNRCFVRRLEPGWFCFEMRF